MFEAFTNRITGSLVIILNANSNILGVNLGFSDLFHGNSPVNFAYIFTILNCAVFCCIRYRIFDTINSEVIQISSVQDNRLFTFCYGNMLVVLANSFTSCLIIVFDANSNILGVNLGFFDLLHGNSPVNFAYIFTILNCAVFCCIRYRIFDTINSKVIQISSVQNNRLFAFCHSNMLIVLTNSFTSCLIIVFDVNSNFSAIDALSVFFCMLLNYRRNFLCRHGNRCVAA